jgi:hypothetical protein
MRTHHEPRVDFSVLGTTSLLALALGRGPAETVGILGQQSAKIAPAAPVGLWLSADGTVRLDIRTDGTYAGKVAGRKRPAHGTYRLDGSVMTLQDDDGPPTPVTVLDGRLEMAGHRLSRDQLRLRRN